MPSNDTDNVLPTHVAASFKFNVTCITDPPLVIATTDEAVPFNAQCELLKGIAHEMPV